ncbi:hypothetical protein V8G54_028440 [Vigna mungo]|uniref:Uncharacterized protein n=1 Tax=Vigna mungo TaxID=3915 RepID=A0AAQ3MSZ7_VIGMU
MFSGHWECWRMEWTAAMEPRRYSTSRVMATWTREGSQTLVFSGMEVRLEAHLSALRNGAARRKESGDVWRGRRRTASRWEERMASAGWKDWREGERRMRSIAAEKKPENLMSHNISLGGEKGEDGS